MDRNQGHNHGIVLPRRTFGLGLLWGLLATAAGRFIGSKPANVSLRRAEFFKTLNRP